MTPERYEAPPQRHDKPRVRMCACRFCQAQVDSEVVAAARHLLYACGKATPAAKDAARKVLADMRKQEEQRVAEQARGDGVPEEQIADLLRKLRAQDYEMAGPPPDLKHDRVNGVSTKVMKRMIAQMERLG